MRDVSAHVKVSWKVYGVLDTVENRTRLPSALGQTLQRLSAQRTMRESSLVMEIGGCFLLGAAKKYSVVSM